MNFTKASKIIHCMNYIFFSLFLREIYTDCKHRFLGPLALIDFLQPLSVLYGNINVYSRRELNFL